MAKIWQNTKSFDEPASITFKSIQTHLQSYPSHIPSKLRALDTLRFVDIPAKLAQRKKDGDAFLEKNEVASLVEWKLKHGTFRPKLANLVASNSDSEILSTTKSSFATYEADNDAYAASITALSSLKGIGPATASLLLSCYDPVRVPFFSDQLFRYALWQRTAGCGWDRKIKYSMNQYSQMFEKVQALRKRLEQESGNEVSAVELEKMAYVLGKEAQPDSKRYPVDEKGAEGGEKAEQPAESSRKRKSNASKDEGEEKQSGRQPETKRRKNITSKEHQQTSNKP